MVFLLVSSLSLRNFLLIKSSIFSPRFLIKFRRFFHQLNTHSFFFSFPLGLEGFFSTITMISNVTCLLKLASKRKSNYNIKILHDQSYDRSILIGKISYHNLFSSWTFINHLSSDLPNILDQLFESTSQINLLNQLFELTYAINLLIELAILLVCSTLLPLINIRT